MSRKFSEANLNRDYRRNAAAARRLGKQAQCTRCGEDRPEALIAGSKPRTCAACQRTIDGRAQTDLHHVAGQNNHRATVPIPVNDHRARLSPAQYNWPLRTLRNPDESPLLEVAACIRGFIDLFEYCIETFLKPNAAALEKYDADLVEKLGTRWWIDAKTKQSTNEEKPNENK